MNSKLKNTEIKNILIGKYNIIPTNITAINRGTADIFKIETKNKKYILKQFIEGRELNLIEKEINLIRYLKEKNIKVPIYIKTKDEKFHIKYNNRIIIVQEYIEGYTIKDNGADYTRTIECAKILGKLTQAMKGYKELTEEGIMEKSFSKDSLEKGIIKMKNFQNDIKSDNKYREIFYKDMEYKIKIANKLLETFDFNVISKITVYNTHGDYSMQQLIFNDNNETTIIDFERAKKMPIIWEIMRSYTYIDKEAEDGFLNLDTLVEYFKEFSKYIKLNKYDLKYAPHVYLIQLSTSIFGYKEYNEDYKKESLLNFGFFRTNVCKYLYNNLDEISDKLIQEVI